MGDNGGVGRGDGSGKGSRPPGALSMTTEGESPKPVEAAAAETVQRTVTADSAEEVPGTASREPRLRELKPVASDAPRRVPTIGEPASPGEDRGVKSSTPLSSLCTGTPEKTVAIPMAGSVALSEDSEDTFRRVSAQGAR